MVATQAAHQSYPSGMRIRIIKIAANSRQVKVSVNPRMSATGRLDPSRPALHRPCSLISPCKIFCNSPVQSAETRCLPPADGLDDRRQHGQPVAGHDHDAEVERNAETAARFSGSFHTKIIRTISRPTVHVAATICQSPCFSRMSFMSCTHGLKSNYVLPHSLRMGWKQKPPRAGQLRGFCFSVR